MTQRQLGYVDHLRQALFSFSTSTGEPVLGTVDTGYNGALMIANFQIVELGFPPIVAFASATMANGGQVQVGRTVGSIRWFGRLQEIQIDVVLEAPKPITLIGTALLAQGSMGINYKSGRAFICQKERE